MKLVLSDDKRFFIVIGSSSSELEQLEYSLTKKLDNFYIMQKKNPNWNCEIKFIDKYSRIPIGLLWELKNISKKYDIPMDVSGVDEIYDNDFDNEGFLTWMNGYFSKSIKIKPRDYQIEGTLKLFKYKNCTEEISTSGGKTLIGFLFFKYLREIKYIKKLLYVVPSKGLVGQSEDKFYEYEDHCKKKPDWKSMTIFGDAPDYEEGYEPDIVFGTYQSLVKKNLQFFQQFDAVIIDESHLASSTSHKNILIKCINAKYKVGLTGTLPKDGSCDSFIIQSYLGPKVFTLKSDVLIEEGSATPINVVGLEMHYLDEQIKSNLYDMRNVSADEKDGAKLLNLEKDVMRSNRKRFNYVCQTINKVTKNSLVLFGDIKNDYGRNIYNWLNENTDHTVFYMDGGTDNKNREYYKQQMETAENVIIVASVGTFSEGIDVKKLFNIFLVESCKSEQIIAQILGRGMRIFETKQLVYLFDFIDNYMFGSNKYQHKNYLMRHADERARIYRERKFPYKRFIVKL